MELIGRSKEKAKLRYYYESKSSQFIVIYGRRRIGKTFLIKKYFEDKLFFSFSGTYEENVKVQIKDFINKLELKAKANNWRDCFNLLIEKIKNSPKKEKKVIFIDELSWIKKSSITFLNALEYFYNDFCSIRDDILLIVCSSATTWIINNVFSNKGGLYNRTTDRILLQPFSLKECEQFLLAKNINYTQYDIAELYMIFGGIPYYLDFIKKGLSVAQNIDEIFFVLGAPLFNEFEKIFSAMFSNSKKHEEIIKIIFDTKKGLTRKDIVDKSKVKDGGNLTKILNDLELCGFIRKYNRYPDLTKNSLYQLIDPFCLFYLAFVNTSNSYNINYWLSQTTSSTINIWRGYAFEIVCLHHVEEIKKAIGIDKINTSVSSFSDKENQIDLIISRQDRIVDLCEIKFYQGEVEINKEYDLKIRNRSLEFSKHLKKNYAINIVFITPFGVLHNMYYSLVDNDITLADLFA
jgi:AAA+ ATPase superfamily predicted ATPase